MDNQGDPIKPSKGYQKIYERDYKKLLAIPFIILALALLQISFQVITTGDFVDKGISLKGGLTMTVPTDVEIDTDALEIDLMGRMSGVEVSVRTLAVAGQATGYIVESDIEIQNTEQVDALVDHVAAATGKEFSSDDYSIEGIGSALGASFFREAFIAIIVAFLFMGIVVFLYFRTIVPSLAVILAAFSDMVITLAVINILGVKLSTAGIAAFLMLIGYSVDTDILLSTKVLKRKSGTVMERIYTAMKTGITMNLSTMAAVTIAFIISQSEVIRQIMLIILIGLMADLINTWIQNVGLLRWYLDNKANKK
jgi:preprotein translocase subunit SecF